MERSDLFLVVEEAGPGGATLQRPLSLQESMEALVCRFHHFKFRFYTFEKGDCCE